MAPSPGAGAELVELPAVAEADAPPARVRPGTDEGRKSLLRRRCSSRAAVCALLMLLPVALAAALARHVVGRPPVDDEHRRRHSQPLAAGTYSCFGTVDQEHGEWIGDARRAHADGCGAPGVLDGWRAQLLGQRRFVLVIPASTSKAPMALVLLAPSTGRSPESMLEMTRLAELARAERVAVAALAGVHASLNVGKDAQPGAHGPDDVAYARAVVRAARRLVRPAVEPRRVYCAGHSRGARFCSMLADRLPATIAAIAAVGGVRFPRPRTSARAVPVLSFHGCDDPINPYGGGGAAYWGTGVPSAILDWAKSNGCAEVSAQGGAPGAGCGGAPGGRADGGTVHVDQHTRCADGADVMSYTVEGAGHTWPGSTHGGGRKVGALMPEPWNGTQLVLAFFRSHSMPPQPAQDGPRPSRRSAG